MFKTIYAWTRTKREAIAQERFDEATNKFRIKIRELTEAAIDLHTDIVQSRPSPLEMDRPRGIPAERP
jgi:hypothetical protein